MHTPVTLTTSLNSMNIDWLIIRPARLCCGLLDMIRPARYVVPVYVGMSGKQDGGYNACINFGDLSDTPVLNIFTENGSYTDSLISNAFEDWLIPLLLIPLYHTVASVQVC